MDEKEPLKYLDYLRNNISKGWRTTIFGALIFLAGIATMFLPESDVSWWQSVAIMLIGVLVACLRDPKKGSRVSVVVFLIGLSLTSCVTEQKCLEKFGGKEVSKEVVFNSDSTLIEYRDSVVYVPGDTVRFSVPSPCDSLGNLKDFHYTYRGRNNAVITAKNNDGKLELECLCEDEKIVISKQSKLISKLQKSKSEKTKTNVLYKKYIPWYINWKMIIIYVVSSYFIGRFRLDKKLLKLIV